MPQNTTSHTKGRTCSCSKHGGGGGLDKTSTPTAFTAKRPPHVTGFSCRRVNVPQAVTARLLVPHGSRGALRNRWQLDVSHRNNKAKKTINDDHRRGKQNHLNPPIDHMCTAIFHVAPLFSLSVSATKTSSVRLGNLSTAISHSERQTSRTQFLHR